MKHDTGLTVERLREALAYDPETGVFTWKIKAAQRLHVGDVAGGPDSKGYIRIRLDGVLRFAQRLAWLYVYGEWPTGEVDHKNRTPGDNRISNLRDGTRSDNQHNAGVRTDNKSGITGVYERRNGKWGAQIMVHTKNRHLGIFDTAEEAHAAYLAAKRELHPFWIPACS